MKNQLPCIPKLIRSYLHGTDEERGSDELLPIMRLIRNQVVSKSYQFVLVLLIHLFVHRPISRDC